MALPLPQKISKKCLYSATKMSAISEMRTSRRRALNARLRARSIIFKSVQRDNLNLYSSFPSGLCCLRLEHLPQALKVSVWADCVLQAGPSGANKQSRTEGNTGRCCSRLRVSDKPPTRIPCPQSVVIKDIHLLCVLGTTDGSGQEPDGMGAELSFSLWLQSKDLCVQKQRFISKTKGAFCPLLDCLLLQQCGCVGRCYSNRMSG